MRKVPGWILFAFNRASSKSFVAERKPGFFVNVKDGEDFSRRNTRRILRIKFEPDAEIGEKDGFRSATDLPANPI